MTVQTLYVQTIPPKPKMPNGWYELPEAYVLVSYDYVIVIVEREPNCNGKCQQTRRLTPGHNFVREFDDFPTAFQDANTPGSPRLILDENVKDVVDSIKARQGVWLCSECEIPVVSTGS